MSWEECLSKKVFFSPDRLFMQDDRIWNDLEIILGNDLLFYSSQCIDLLELVVDVSLLNKVLKLQNVLTKQLRLRYNMFKIMEHYLLNFELIRFSKIFMVHLRQINIVDDFRRQNKVSLLLLLNNFIKLLLRNRVIEFDIESFFTHL